MQLRPSLIFDACESITSDMGAAQFMKSIRVAERDKLGQPKHIHIDFDHVFASAPALTALHDSTAIYLQTVVKKDPGV